MCGRFVLLTDLSKIVQSFDIQEVSGHCHPNANISPGQMIAAVVYDNMNRLLNFKWGLIPAWAKDPAIGNKMINARAETVFEKPSFRQAFRKRRCLIVADGFYEWKKEAGKKTPMRFYLKSGEPFGFAGLYETWVSPDKVPINTCTIITTDANDLVSSVHDRMPVIVKKENEALWIDPENQDQQQLLSILKPYPADQMEMAEASI
jgi:putative SOS response-associated peptidase YedK